MSLTKTEIHQLPMCIERFHANLDTHTQIVSMPNVQKAVFQTKSLWSPGDVINVSFLDLPDTNERYPQWYNIDVITSNLSPGEKVDPIEKIVRDKFAGDNYDPIGALKYVIKNRLQPVVSVKFNWVDSDGDVRVLFDTEAGGSASLVGKTVFSETDKTKPTTWFSWLDCATFIHEFCHVLGMVHEHQNPRGAQIQWNKCAVLAWTQTQEPPWTPEQTYTNIIKKYSIDSTNGSDFDPKSIMLYHYPPELTTNCRGTRANFTLSDMDKKWLSSIYPGGSEKIATGTTGTTGTTGKNGKNGITGMKTGSSGVNATSSATGVISDDSKKKKKITIAIIVAFIVFIIGVLLILYFNKKR